MIESAEISAAVARFERWLPAQPQLAIVLGSGLSSLPEQLSQRQTLAYAELPGLPKTGAAGHAGLVHYGKFAGHDLLVFQGRFHCYEGYSAWQVTALVRLAAALRCPRLLLTNAVGGLNAAMQPGDYMLAEDHLNFTGLSPLVGQQDAFIDLGRLYHRFPEHLTQELAAKDIALHRGVLAWMLGPSYETSAEIRALKRLGADAVGMSTVPEAIMAHYCGIDVAVLSLITNLGAGLSPQPLGHEDVLQVGARAAQQFPTVLSRLIANWG